ncbi:hypothetical protein V2P20_07065 [Methylobacter sp. Wu1]|uniref:hypothetical protein n=1 Tax=Methylobacter sp. Wu1 TaxID=3119359 RepID=UPI002F923EF4
MPVLLQPSFAPLPIAPVAFLSPNFSHALNGRSSGLNRDCCRRMRLAMNICNKKRDKTFTSTQKRTL